MTVILPRRPDQSDATQIAPPPNNASIGAKPVAGTGALVAEGTVWLFLQTLGTKAVLFLGQIVLAWLLVPEDFGQIAMAYTVTSFVALVTNPGVDIILVRRGRRFHLWSTPAFYFSLSTGLLSSLLILASAPLVAATYGVPRLTELLAILALATPLGSLMLVPTAKLRSQMQFKALAAVNLLQTFLQTLLTLVFALIGFGVYSFVLPMPVVYATIAAVLWFIARPRIRIRNPLRHWRYLVGDSSYIFGQRALLTVVGQGDYIILGALYGAAVLGPYFFAFGIAKQAIRLTAGSLQLVLLAGLARMPAFSARQTQAALRATKAVTLLGIPLCILQAAIAGPLLRALYGEKWLEAIPLVQLISLGMAFDVISWTTVSLLQARGQFRFMFIWSSISATVFLVAISVGAVYGESLGVAGAICCFFVVFSPLLAFWVFRSSNVGWAEVFDMYLRPLLVGLLTAAASTAAQYIFSAAGYSPLVQAGLAIGAGLVTLPVCAMLIMPSTCSDIATRASDLLSSTLLTRLAGKNTTS